MLLFRETTYPYLIPCKLQKNLHQVHNFFILGYSSPTIDKRNDTRDWIASDSHCRWWDTMEMHGLWSETDFTSDSLLLDRWYKLSWDKNGVVEIWYLKMVNLVQKVNSEDKIFWLFLIVLAVGYSSGRISLCDVENASCLHSLQLASGLTHLSWSSDIVPALDSQDRNDRNLFHDFSSSYLPKLPILPKR